MIVRRLTRSDWLAVNRLHREVWWPERSLAGWRWLESNPGRRRTRTPLGWVVADEAGRPAAFLGNFVQRFWRGDRAFAGATGFSLIVPPSLKGRSRELIGRFLAQPGCALFYTFNANPRSAPLYPRFGLAAWPADGHDLKLSWVVRPLDCLAARGLRLVVARRPGLAPRLGERLMPPAPGADLMRRIERRLEGEVTPLTDFSDRSPYAGFWRALKGEGRLVADRSPRTLRWRLSDPDQTRPPLALAWRAPDGGIGGYLLAQLAKGNPIEPATLEIVDLCALQARPEVIPALVRSLIAAAGVMGAAKVRLQVVHPWVKAALGPLADQARREGGWGHCHVRHGMAPDALDDWRATPFEGDYGLCLRPTPHRAGGLVTSAPG